jgi:hypothetical protein
LNSIRNIEEFFYKIAYHGPFAETYRLDRAGLRMARFAINFHASPALSTRAQHAASQTDSFDHLLSRLAARELRRITQHRTTDFLVQPLASFHAESRYGGDLHRADMAWALHAAAHGLSQKRIEYEILNSRDLSKKGPPLRRLAYATRTASKAIALAAQ